MQDELKPELRFPEFRDNWKKKKLKKVISDIRSGVSVNSVNEPISECGEIGILRMSCVSGGQFFSFENKKILEEENDRAKLNPGKGNIIFSRMNTPKLVGESGYVDENYPSLYLPDRLWLLYINELKSNPLFASILLTTGKRTPALSSSSTSATAVSSAIRTSASSGTSPTTNCSTSREHPYSNKTPWPSRA